MSRSLVFTSMWRDISTTGASWTLRMPQIVRKDALVWHFLRYGSEAQVRDLFQRSEASPYDVDEGRQSLAYVSIEMHVQTSIY
jgi:hypothetical protein